MPNPRIKVFYYDDPDDRRVAFRKARKVKLVRARSEEKAIIIFRKRFPHFEPAYASKW